MTESEYQEFTVLLSFKYAAYDEREGYAVVVTAKTKRDAIKAARREFDRAGHFVGLAITEYSLRVVDEEEGR